MSDEEGRSILAVEDDPGMGTLLGIVLQRERGDRTRVTRNAREALALCQSDPPDVVFLMWWWAGGMHATEFCEALRAMPEGRHIPVVVTSAQTSIEFFRALRQSGANGHIAAPCHPREFVAARDAVLAGERYNLPDYLDP
jgi:CheY-like chemotaxis protein